MKEARSFTPILGAALLVVMALAGCQQTRSALDTIQEKLDPQPARHDIVALVDLSGSLADSVVETFTESLETQVWRAMGARDRLVVLPIDAASEPSSDVLFSGDLATRDFTDPHDGVARAQAKADERRQAFLDEQAAILRDSVAKARERRGGFRNRSDILGALRAATSAFSSTPGSRVLLVYSDMVQESAELNLSGLNRADAASARVESLASGQRIPDLKDVKVLVVGAGGGAAESAGARGRSEVDLAHFEAVRAFWFEYFSRAGAVLDARHYIDSPARQDDRFAELLAR